jgi:hypothetical protein
MRADVNGNSQWSKTFGGPLDEEGKSVIENSDGSFAIASGDSSALTDWDVHLRKTDASGNLIWDKTFGGDKKDVCKSMQPANDGGYIIGATSRSFGWINPQMWLVKIDGGGTLQWEHHYGEWWHNHCYMVKQFSDGGFIAVGHSTDSSYSLTRMMFVKTDAGGTVPVPEFASRDFSFGVYPNPSSGEFSVSGLSSPSELSICNAAGEKITPRIIPASSEATYEVNIASMPKGIYFIEVRSKNERRTKKIIIE